MRVWVALGIAAVFAILFLQITGPWYVLMNNGHEFFVSLPWQDTPDAKSLGLAATKYMPEQPAHSPAPRVLVGLPAVPVANATQVVTPGPIQLPEPNVEI